MKLGSLFDGAGTCPYAATLCGVTPVWASEIEPFPVAVTTKRFPNMKHLGDITLINGAEIEPVDIITFGSPCTRLSQAGKHDGFNITFVCWGDDKEAEKAHYTEEIRATDKYKYLYETVCPICGKHLTATNESALFFNAIRIITEMRAATDGKYPRFIMWENVPGAFSSNKGEDFRTVLEEICKVKDCNAVIPRPKKWSDAGEILADEYSVAWRVLDAQFWGVPQRRRRIFLVADFGGQRAGEILFKRKGLRWDPAEGRAAGQGIATDTESGFGAAGFIGRQGASAGSIGYQVEQSPTLRAEQETHCLQSAIPINTQIATRHKALGRGAGFGIGEEGDPAYTLQEAHSHAVFCSAGFNGHKSITGSIQYAEETAPTLESNMPSNVIAYACRTDQTGSNGLGISEDVAYTLDQASGQAICYDVDSEMNASADKMGTLRAHCSGGAEQFTLYENHAQDSRITGPLDVSLTCSHKWGTGGNNTPLTIDNYTARRLMPVETARLQGMPDWWVADVPHKDTAEYKMWGNGMALPCVMYVMEGLAEETAVRIFEERLGGLR